MNALLQKTYFRIIISLLGSGLIQEIIHINTGDPNRPQESNPLLFIFSTILIYFLFTYLLKKSGRIK